MNILQRIVLIVGAIALLIMLGTVETHQQLIRTASIIDNSPAVFEHYWDWHSAIVRGAIISATTAAIYFAVGKSRK